MAFYRLNNREQQAGELSGVVLPKKNDRAPFINP